MGDTVGKTITGLFGGGGGMKMVLLPSPSGCTIEALFCSKHILVGLLLSVLFLQEGEEFVRVCLRYLRADQVGAAVSSTDLEQRATRPPPHLLPTTNVPRGLVEQRLHFDFSLDTNLTDRRVSVCSAVSCWDCCLGSWRGWARPRVPLQVKKGPGGQRFVQPPAAAPARQAPP